MKLDLNARQFGEEFAPFEQELIFLKQEEHIGWVEHTGAQTFKLKLTPFYDQCRKYEYIAPAPNLLPPQRLCIEVKPFKIIREPVFEKKSLYGKYQNYCIIDSYKEYKILLPKPNIGYKDFLYHCSVNWIDAEEDDLDTLLALQLVSCPSSFYGKGGIGTMASKLTGYGKLSNQIVPQLNNTYNSIIAANFQKTNDIYLFNMIKTTQNTRFINQIRSGSSSCEVNYCKPCVSIKEAQAAAESIPIQIPLLIKGASRYKKADDLAEPYFLLQYQLTALMHEPSFGDSNSALNKIEENIRQVIEESNGVLNVDSNTINKLALSFSRLYLNDYHIKNNDIKEATKIFISHLNDWKPYINESQETSNFRKHTSALDTHVRFSSDHQMFMVELQKLHDETGETWIDWLEFEKRIDKKKLSFIKDIAFDLNNLGMIIQQFNFSKIRKVKL